jgi:hypothetical protein
MDQVRGWEQAIAQMRGARGPGVTINVYPQPGQDERDIAAAVSRELAWAIAGGAT